MQEVDETGAEMDLEKNARLILENLENAPVGAIMALEPSNVKRADQTRSLFINKIRELLGQREDIEIVELGENREDAEQLLSRMRQEPGKKFIIPDLRGSWLIGFKDTDVHIPETNKWKNKLHGDENLLGKVWAAHSNEINALAGELKNLGIDVTAEEINPQAFKATPELLVVRFLTWIASMRKIGESHFPNRTLILEGISHSVRSDYTTLALLGEDISVESINRVLGGEFRKPFERSKIVFGGNGKIKIAFRDKEKEYTPEEFEMVVNSIQGKLNAREVEWGQRK